MTISNYHRSLTAFYLDYRTLRANCANNLAAFTAFKPAYDAALITTRLELLQPKKLCQQSIQEY